MDSYGIVYKEMRTLLNVTQALIRESNMNTQEWNPGSLLETSGYYWRTCTLHAGVKLDVFTAIGDNQLTIKEIAQKLNADQRGVTMLLNTLTAMNLAPRLVPSINLSNRRHLLDLGGGPGTYAIYFCLNNPQLKATVYDLPTTKPFAKKIIEKYNLVDRIDFIGGNYLEENIDKAYDVAWLSQILHGEGPENCQRIIQKAVSALEPGGMIIVHEFILNNTMDGPIFPALFSLNMLLGTPNGQSYSEKQIMDMLAKAGVKEINRIPVETPNDSGIIAGVI